MRRRPLGSISHSQESTILKSHRPHCHRVGATRCHGLGPHCKLRQVGGPHTSSPLLVSQIVAATTSGQYPHSPAVEHQCAGWPVSQCLFSPPERKVSANSRLTGLNHRSRNQLTGWAFAPICTNCRRLEIKSLGPNMAEFSLHSLTVR